MTFIGTSEQIEAKRKAGRKGGAQTAASGQLERTRNLPQTKAAQRAVGLKHAESGHLKRIQNLPQTKAAQRANGLKQMTMINNLPQTQAARIRNGHTQGLKGVASGHLDAVRPKDQGLKNVESGHMQRLATPESRSKGGIIQGPIAGRIAVSSGQLLSIAPSGGRMACHLRWHVNRGIVNPKCELCTKPKE
jgi:hypothetical protein